MAPAEAVAVHCRVEGPEGAPVVVLSGSLGTELGVWDAQVAALAGRFRVVRYDHRGHGRSPVPRGPYALEDLGRDLLALLDRLGLERVSLCGLSLGGLVGMWAASEAAQRFERLILACTSSRFAPPEQWHERAATVRARGVAAVADAVLGRWFTPAFRARAPETVERMARMLVSTPAEGYAGCCEALAAADARARLRAIRAPTLVIAGANDPATPPDRARLMKDEIREAELVVLPEAAHLASVECPEAFTEALVRHLTRSPHETKEVR